MYVLGADVFIRPFFLPEAKAMNFPRFTLWALISLSVAPSLTASEGATDAREQCRILVSGSYLGYLNDLDILKSNLASTSESLFGMKAKRKLAAKRLSALEAQSEAQKTPAAELDEDLLGLRYKIETADDEIRDGEARIVIIKDQIAAKETSFKAFKEGMKPVFEVINAKIVNQGAYPLMLQYRQLCNTFQQLCPLPASQSAALIRFSKQLEGAVPCIHYANMRGQ